MSRDSVVLYADMMGFGSLVESYPDLGSLTPDMLEALSPTSASETYALNPAGRHPLVGKLGTFHKALASHLGYAQASHTLLFSDSCFMVFEDYVPAFQTAQGLMNHLLRAAVPVRMGLAAGTFVAGTLTSSTSPSAALHVAQFFGTAVVRAHRAERVDIPGFRAFIHPSLRPEAWEHFMVKHAHIPLEAASADAVREINYVGLGSGTIGMSVSEMGRIVPVMEELKRTAPPGAHRHYDSTVIAMKRMYNYSLGKHGTPIPEDLSAPW